MVQYDKKSVFDDKKLFQKAYKKLKSDAYYDKTKVILKREIVEFESHFKTINKLDEFLDDVQYKLINSDKNTWADYVKTNVLNTIRCIFLPKNIKEKAKNTNGIISNVGQDFGSKETLKVRHLPYLKKNAIKIYIE
jgi:hypothetical protein